MAQITNEPIRILFAEDDDSDFLLIEEALEDAGLANPYDRVLDGEQLLARLRDSQAPKPDIILLDLNMSPMGGIEALNYINADPSLRNIPVVVLTTSQTDRHKCKELGVADYRIKPTTQDELIGILKDVLDCAELVIG